jgi:hypothetical protein
MATHSLSGNVQLRLHVGGSHDRTGGGANKKSHSDGMDMKSIAGAEQLHYFFFVPDFKIWNEHMSSPSMAMTAPLLSNSAQ